MCKGSTFTTTAPYLMKLMEDVLLQKEGVNQDSRKYRMDGIRTKVNKLPGLQLCSRLEEQIVQTTGKWRDLDEVFSENKNGNKFKKQELVIRYF